LGENRLADFIDFVPAEGAIFIQIEGFKEDFELLLERLSDQ
jgi:hypothetical protein